MASGHRRRHRSGRGHGTARATRTDATDNGAVFTGHCRHRGWVALERELTALGIALSHSKPYHPRTCGKVERTHQTIKNWLYQQGQLAPLLRAERDLSRARLAAGQKDSESAAVFAVAVKSLRELSTPYHLAHGLLDHAQFLRTVDDKEAARSAVEEAIGIATRLSCKPLLNRAATLRAAIRPNGKERHHATKPRLEGAAERTIDF
jgi:transposase InsO family protein